MYSATRQESVSFSQLSFFFFLFLLLHRWGKKKIKEGRVGSGQSLWGHFFLLRARKHFYFLLSVLNLRFAVSFPSTFCLVLLFHFLCGGHRTLSSAWAFFFSSFQTLSPSPSAGGGGAAAPAVLLLVGQGQTAGREAQGAGLRLAVQPGICKGLPGSSCPTCVLSDFSATRPVEPVASGRRGPGIRLRPGRFVPRTR